MTKLDASLYVCKIIKFKMAYMYDFALFCIKKIYIFFNAI